MFTSRAKKILQAAKVLVTLLALSVSLGARAIDGGTVDAGTVISNRAEATYSDATGSSYSAVSLTVTITVLPVATLVVTPDETVSSDTIAPHDQVTRQFRICNTGNGVDTFSLTKVDLTEPATAGSLYFDVDGSGTVNDGDVPITLNETQTPQL